MAFSCAFPSALHPSSWILNPQLQTHTHTRTHLNTHTGFWHLRYEVEWNSAAHADPCSISHPNCLWPSRVHHHRCTTNISKETYINQKRPISIKRDLYQSNETCIDQKRPISPTIEVRRVCRKRHISIKGETCINQIRPISTKRDLYQLKETYINQKKPESIKRELHQSKDQKETYINEKRPISMKRPRGDLLTI